MRDNITPFTVLLLAALVLWNTIDVIDHKSRLEALEASVAAGAPK